MQDIAFSVQQSLTVFQQAQLFGAVDQYVRIGADAEATAFGQILAGRKYAVPQVGLGDRAQAGGGTTGCQLLHLGGCDVRRMYQAPALVDSRMVEQPLDWAATRPLLPLIYFGLLFGDVKVNWGSAGKRNELLQLLRSYRPQAVGS